MGRPRAQEPWRTSASRGCRRRRRRHLGRRCSCAIFGSGYKGGVQAVVHHVEDAQSSQTSAMLARISRPFARAASSMPSPSSSGHATSQGARPPRACTTGTASPPDATITKGSENAASLLLRHQKEVLGCTVFEFLSTVITSVCVHAASSRRRRVHRCFSGEED
jgi:hypothetical protein